MTTKRNGYYETIASFERAMETLVERTNIARATFGHVQRYDAISMALRALEAEGLLRIPQGKRYELTKLLEAAAAIATDKA